MGDGSLQRNPNPVLCTVPIENRTCHHSPDRWSCIRCNAETLGWTRVFPFCLVLDSWWPRWRGRCFEPAGRRFNSCRAHHSRPVHPPPTSVEIFQSVVRRYPGCRRIIPLPKSHRPLASLHLDLCSRGIREDQEAMLNNRHKMRTGGVPDRLHSDTQCAWTRQCPSCGRRLEKWDPMSPWICTCGWQS